MHVLAYKLIILYVIGCSIGSLGKDLEEEGVKNVTVKKAVFTGTQNGLRIKSWAKPSKGFVQGVQFLNVLMQNVQNPIIIDQNYCPHNINCPDQVRYLISQLFHKNGKRKPNIIKYGENHQVLLTDHVMFEYVYRYPAYKLAT